MKAYASRDDIGKNGIARCEVDGTMKVRRHRQAGLAIGAPVKPGKQVPRWHGRPRVPPIILCHPAALPSCPATPISSECNINIAGFCSSLWFPAQSFISAAVCPQLFEMGRGLASRRRRRHESPYEAMQAVHVGFPIIAIISTCIFEAY
jgi:hypothetical protein